LHAPDFFKIIKIINLLFILSKVNSRFGFGLLNAAALTEAAKNWVTVPKQSICEIEPVKFQSQYEFTSKD
jgi:hypothetical protein